MARTVADKLVSILADSGVQRIYGLIGDSLNPVGAALSKDKRISWISVRHEESAAFAAGTEAFLSGQLGVCAATTGPGSVHLINGLYEANRNGAPVLAIVSHIPSSQTGLDYFQETNPAILYKDCSIFCEMISHPSQMPRLLQEGMQAALSKKGVAVIVLPKDISLKEIENSPYERTVFPTPAAVIPPPDEIKKLADIVNSHERITLYCGIGCREAKAEILAFAETVKAPVVHTIRSKEFMENGNPNDVGLNGFLSFGESREALETCGLLMLIGTDYPYEVLLPTKPAVVQIDIKGEHLGRRSRLDFGLCGDIRSVMDSLLPMIREKKNDTHLRNALKFKNTLEKKKEDALHEMASMHPLRPEYLSFLINQEAPENAVFTIDVGLNDVWTARYLKACGTRRIIGSFKHATMAAAVPGAIGACYVADKDVPVIALAGDGGLTMLLGELLTIVQHNIPVKIVVYNNGELGYINFEAKTDGIAPFQTTLKNPDFAKLAEVIGIKGFRVDSPEKARETIRRFLDEPGPALLDAVTDGGALP